MEIEERATQRKHKLEEVLEGIAERIREVRDDVEVY